jgi:Rrf2 family transcriptional regulator, cysteine metabolism repressor
MLLSQKCQYAFRATFELARRHGTGQPISVAEIAQAQAIPPRFLEQILGELRHGGFVTSTRGSQGGYALAIAPEALTVGDIIRFVEGPLAPVQCVSRIPDPECGLKDNCLFIGFWQRAASALEQVYNGTTFQDLVDQSKAQAATEAVNFSI